MSATAVGIVGVGTMGMAVAERLIAAGHAVTGYRRGSLDAFKAAGGRPAGSAAEAACADWLILLLPSDAALAETMAAILPVLRREQAILCLGTHTLAAKTEAAAVAAQAGAVLLDGEISGTAAMMHAGLASVLIAGDADAAERARPVLNVFARATTQLGAFGNATKMKLITNYLVGVHTLAAAEALRLAARLGLDPGAVVAAVSPSAGGSTMLTVRGRMMAEGNPAGGDMVGFMRFFDLLHGALPELSQADAPLLALTEAAYRRAIADGYGARDIAAIYEALAAAR